MGKSNKSGAEKLILGGWDWKETVFTGGVACPPKTPQSAGYTEHRRFLIDGHVEFYRDGKLIDTYPYRIGPKPDRRTGVDYYQLWIGEDCSGLKITSETLIIGCGGMFGLCGVDTVFIKAK
jgi:hypothetical protein